MAAAQDRHLLADHALAASARRGVRSAFDELYGRHALAAWRLAVVVTRDVDEAGEVVANAFASTLTRASDVDATTPAPSFRVALLGATRRCAIDVVSQRGSRGVAPPDVPVLDALEPRVAVIRRAFEELPERWRSVLWLIEVDGVASTDAAHVVHVAPTAIAPLLERAHHGFQEQVLLIGIGASARSACRRTSDRLTDYRVGSLVEGDEAQVRSHLDGCEACRARLASLDDLIPVLRGAGHPLPVALADVAAARWSAALVVDAGPLRLALPGGQPMPVWAQRAFAGVVAGVVALGITGATMIAGRGRSGGRDVVARPALAGGESALGTGLSDLDLSDGGLAALPTTPPASGAPAAQTSAPALPRTDGPSSADASPPAASAPPLATGDGAVEQSATDGAPPAEAPPSGSGSSQSVTIGVDGVGWVTIGPDCQGGELFGQGGGSCSPPPEGGDPVTVSVPTSASAASSML